MAVYKDNKTNTWRVVYRIPDWKGGTKQSQKRGFPTKREALAWEREFLNKTQADQRAYYSHEDPAVLRQAQNQRYSTERRYCLAE